MVVLDAADLDALPLPTRRKIDVLGFVPDDDVDPILYDRLYWVAAHGPAAQRPYALTSLVVQKRSSLSLGLSRTGWSAT
jgi:DNA end-binding protein Ku